MKNIETNIFLVTMTLLTVVSLFFIQRSSAQSATSTPTLTPLERANIQINNWKNYYNDTQKLIKEYQYALRVCNSKIR